MRIVLATLLIFIIVILVLVVVHELGHFFVAKMFGVRVEEFGVGYPPLAKKLFTWRGTLFTLNWLPFGGFVKIFGEEEGTTPKASDSFAYQKLWKRGAIVLAGILANAFLAVVLYSIAFAAGFLVVPENLPPSLGAAGAHQIILTDIGKGSPAALAGLEAGDRIVSLSSEKETKEPVVVFDIVNFIQKHSRQPIVFSVIHNNVQKNISVTPKVSSGSTTPTVGIGLAEVVHVKLPFWESIGQGFRYTWDECKSVVNSLGLLVSGLFGRGHGVLSEVSGPVGIAEIAREAYSLGIGSFLSFVALVSINLAVINLFPFPALDGGRFILELFSKNGRSRINPKVVRIINQASFALLILLMMYVTYHDIVRLAH